MSQNIAKLIDHTLLKPDARRVEIDELIEEARLHNFMSVCVNPCWVKYCYEKLKDTEPVVCTVIGFPLGANCTATKVFETEQAIQDGATEIDMVINVSALKDGKNEDVAKDINAVVTAAKEKAIVKVIIETALLTNDEKVRACLLAEQNGADFVKTSTGFSDGGATVNDVKLMRATVRAYMGVKASGGIRSLNDLESMIAAGANRIGASAGVAIISEKI